MTALRCDLNRSTQRRHLIYQTAAWTGTELIIRGGQSIKGEVLNLGFMDEDTWQAQLRSLGKEYPDMKEARKEEQRLVKRHAQHLYVGKKLA